MSPKKRNLSVSIDTTVRSDYLSFCEEIGMQKGGLLERILKSFLAGECFTPANIGNLDSPACSCKCEAGNAHEGEQ